MNEFSLKNKTILITGASSGIGEKASVVCDSYGAKLVLVGRNKKRLNNTLKNLSKRKHLVIDIDLTKFDELKKRFSSIKDQVGNIDGIINAAGISSTIPFRLFKPDYLDDIININVTAAFYLTKLLIPNLNPTGASIIFISSVMAKHGEMGKTIYSISKGAVSSGCRSLALEYASKKIRVNSIAPGIVRTPMNKNSKYMTDKQLFEKTQSKYPLGIGESSDVANTCIFLLSDASKWITGTEIIVDGGFSIM